MNLGDHAGCPSSNRLRTLFNTLGRSGLLETVADAVESLDHVEGVVDGLELLFAAGSVYAVGETSNRARGGLGEICRE